jgi:selenocysteine lyase/cysteine desulfurase
VANLGVNERASSDSNEYNDSEAQWQEFRREMPIAERWVYLDHAAVAPLPAPARGAVEQWSCQASEQGDTVWPQWAERVEQIRSRAASLLNADQDEVAFIPNTTAGIGFVAEGLPWQAGDNVVTLENEFPSNLYPWMNLDSRGVETRRVPVAAGRVDVDQLLSSCDERTRVIAISWVSYCSGWRIDVAELARLAHQRDILVFLDAIQGLGVFPLDVRETDIDILAADGHKWMLGPEGAGIMYIRRDLLPRLRPLNVGWNSVVRAHDFSHVEMNLKPAASRYEGGTQNMAGVLALGASLDLLARMGLGATRSAIADRVLSISDYACARLAAAGARITSPREPQHRSGIVVFDVPGQEPAAVRRRLLDAGVVASCRGGGVRISPHAYISQCDIDQLVDAIK